MKLRIGISIAALALVLAIFGIPPFNGAPDAGFAEGQDGFVTKVKRYPNGIYEVSALTDMPGVSPEMVRWWFGEYMQTTEHYERWYPGAHLWMDWENKVPGKYVGASHLVHEYIGAKLSKLRIQFVPPKEILGDVSLQADDIAVCARAGLLEQPIYGGQMCHIIRKTDTGSEMRSRFWLGMVAKRDGNSTTASIEGVIANTYFARVLGVSKSAAKDLMDHCTTEMSILAGFLPALYAKETSTQSTSPAENDTLATSKTEQ